MSYEHVQEVQDDASTGFVYKPKYIDEWEKHLGKLLDKIDEIPIKAKEDDPDVIDLGFFDNIEFKMFKIDGQYRLPRIFLEKLHKNIARQFLNLTKEWVEEFNCYWLEENEDFIRVDLKWFRSHFQLWKIFPEHTRREDVIFLSPIGTIRLLSRASKTTNVLYWLTMKYKDLKLIAFEESEKKLKILDDLEDIFRKDAQEINKIYYNCIDAMISFTLYCIRALNKRVFYWYVHYKGDINFGYHPHQEIRKRAFWDEAMEYHKRLNRYENMREIDKSLIICGECGEEIIDNNCTIHHKWNKEDYKKKAKWKIYFSPEECKLIHNKCHNKIHNKRD